MIQVGSMLIAAPADTSPIMMATLLHVLKRVGANWLSANQSIINENVGDGDGLVTICCPTRCSGRNGSEEDRNAGFATHVTICDPRSSVRNSLEFCGCARIATSSVPSSSFWP